MRPLRLSRLSALAIVWLGSLLIPTRLEAFCGFYVARADAKLFNQASQVVLVRDDDRTVLTMANDFSGELDEFAVVVPVPTVLERGQIHVANRALIDHLDAYTAPRLVEYYDDNPCRRIVYESAAAPTGAAGGSAAGAQRARDLGVSIEATYTVGEYDIVILSAKESNGLETWLRESGYRIPLGASQALGSYLKQGMKFFVARVNIREQRKLGYTFLRPLQVAYESSKFMLPIRLGMVNAQGAQELFVYALTRRGRIETTNYRTVKLSSDVEIPLFVKGEFGDFYRALFTREVERENRRAVFLEYAWDMGWCDPCAADPLSSSELRELGVFWSGSNDRRDTTQGGENVFVTRLHLRYDSAHFPEDLVFQQTADRTNFQGRFILRHPWTGSDRCEEAQAYRRELPGRLEEEAQRLASLTGWNLATIRRKMNLRARVEVESEVPWWRRIWSDDGTKR